MGASEKHAAAYHGRNDVTIAEASAALPAPSAVIGYLVQCETCPQKALIPVQVGAWVCPRCEEVVDPQPLTVTVRRWLPGDPVEGVQVETGHDIGLTHAAEFFPQHQRPGFGSAGGAGEMRGVAGQVAAWTAPEPCPHQAVRYGVCADCGEYPGIGGVTA